jgi:hypothetical protein
MSDHPLLTNSEATEAVLVAEKKLGDIYDELPSDDERNQLSYRILLTLIYSTAPPAWPIIYEAIQQRKSELNPS